MQIGANAIHIRIARPTDNMHEVIRFYRDGFGLKELGSFEDHSGFDGTMLGTPGGSYHLEFTHHRGSVAPPAPTQENLLVFYLPVRPEWQEAVDRMLANGYMPVESFNPYWEVNGKTFEDPDGYRVVLQNDSWTNS